MCKEKELSFSIFLLYSLADRWKKTKSGCSLTGDSKGRNRCTVLRAESDIVR